MSGKCVRSSARTFHGEERATQYAIACVGNSPVRSVTEALSHSRRLTNSKLFQVPSDHSAETNHSRPDIPGYLSELAARPPVGFQMQ